MQPQSVFPNISGKLLLVAASASVLGLFAMAGQAAPVFITSGQNNPTNAGAVAVFSAGPPAVTTTNGNDGEDYWRLHSGPYLADFGGAHYTYNLTAANTTNSSGWTLTYRARIINADRNFEAYFAVIDNGGNAWFIVLVGGPNAGSSAVRTYQAGDEVSFPGLAHDWPGTSEINTTNYHTYQVIYNPTNSKGIFYIDGRSYLTQAYGNQVFAGTVAPTRLEWGDGQGTGAATGTEEQWSLVKFETGQHPLSQVVVQHVGLTNPVVEGFTYNQTGTPTPTLTGSTDTEAYWRIYQPPLDGSSGAVYYRYNLALSNLTVRTWTLTLRAKVNRSAGASGPGSSYVALVDGNDGWVMNLRGGSDVPAGNTGLYYYDSGFLSVRLSSTNPTGSYRTYQMVYDPNGNSGNGSVGYYVDGTLVGTLTRVQVVDVTGPRVEWGDGEGDGGLADAQYALVRFEVGLDPIPAPSMILSRSPPPNATGVDRAATIDITLQDGAAPVQTNMIQLFFNGSIVSPTISKPPGTNLTTIHYDPPGLLPLESSNTVRLVFNATATTLVTNVWSFLVTDGRVTIVQHVGMNSPTCEGWTFFQSGAAILSCDIEPEGFWQIQQTNASAYYRHDLVTSNLTDPSGWTATMRVKLNRASGANTGLLNCYLSVADGGDVWTLNLGGGADVPSAGVGLFDSFGGRYAASDPTLGYRTYQVIYNPSGGGGSGSVTCFLDGLVVGTETRAHAPNTAARRIEFGDGDISSSGGGSDAQYALVRFELGQHPLPALLLSRLGDQLTLSWTATGFQLQTNANLLNPAGWVDVPSGTNSPRVVTIGPGALFFRLRQDR